MDQRSLTFQQHRPRLYGIAYRMLGSRADAEDMLQEAWLRWHRADTERVQNAQAWLTTAVTRLCIDRLRAARAAGETGQRLYTLDAWREAPFYSERERAALAWTEALTRLADTHAPDEAYDSVRAQFSEKELVDLTLAIVAINGWNRFAVGFRAAAGSYRPRQHERAVAERAGTQR